MKEGKDRGGAAVQEEELHPRSVFIAVLRVYKGNEGFPRGLDRFVLGRCRY